MRTSVASGAPAPSQRASAIGDSPGSSSGSMRGARIGANCVDITAMLREVGRAEAHIDSHRFADIGAVAVERKATEIGVLFAPENLRGGIFLAERHRMHGDILQRFHILAQHRQIIRHRFKSVNLRVWKQAGKEYRCDADVAAYIEDDPGFQVGGDVVFPLRPDLISAS